MKRNAIVVVLLVVILGSLGGYYVLQSPEEIPDTVHTEEHISPEIVTPVQLSAEQVAVLEQEFITQMIPHHEEAVLSAQSLIDLGSENEEVLKLAQAIVTAQKTEIADMKQWHSNWYGKGYVDTNTYEPMMRDLTSLTGTARDKAFLEDMIAHHLHAIAMVQDVASQFIRPELKELTKNIASSQSNEVVAMKIILRQI